MKTKARYEYIKELRNKMFFIGVLSMIIFIITFIFSKQIINFLLNYYEISAFTLSPSEGISSMLNLSFFITILFFIPALVYQLFSFSKELIPNKVYKKIKTRIFLMFFLAIGGFFLGIIFFSKIILNGLAEYNIGLAMWSVSKLLYIVLIFGGAIALSLEFIVIIPIICEIGVIKKEKLKMLRPFMIISLLILSALITPPDLISQIMLMIPLYGSYEIGMFLTKLEDKKICLD